GSQAGFSKVAIARPERGIGHGEIRVEADGALEEGYGGGVLAFCHQSLTSQAVGLEGFERGRGSLLALWIEIPLRAERLTQLAPQVSSHSVHGRKHLLLSCGLRLLRS